MTTMTPHRRNRARTSSTTWGYRMARKRRQLDPAVEALALERLEPTERVLDWLEYGPGEVMVRLIDRELHQRLQDRRIKRGGSGRGLLFRRQEGEWFFAGESGWIS